MEERATALQGVSLLSTQGLSSDAQESGRGCILFWDFFPFFLGFFSRFLGFDGFDWYLQRFAAKLSDLHGVVVVVVGWMDGWMDGWLVG